MHTPWHMWAHTIHIPHKHIKRKRKTKTQGSEGQEPRDSLPCPSLLSTHTNTHCGMSLPTAHSTIINMWFFSFKDRSPMFPCQQRICPSIWWRLPGHERSQTLLGAASRWVTAAYDPPSSISGMCFPEYLVQWCFSLILTWKNDVGRRQVPRT